MYLSICYLLLYWIIVHILYIILYSIRDPFIIINCIIINFNKIIVGQVGCLERSAEKRKKKSGTP